MDKWMFLNKKYVTNSLFIKKALELELSLKEFLMLTYFDNDYHSFFNIEELSENLGIPLEEAYQIFNSLLSKKLISVETKKDMEGRMIETISLGAFYDLISNDKKEEKKKVQETDLYGVFEKEFGRTISSMEVEIINAWLEKDYSQELIIGALKEAVYNGVCKLNYIDKILYEWSKKGFKTMNDVKNYMENKTEKTEKKELFDYDWVNNDEN